MIKLWKRGPLKWKEIRCFDCLENESANYAKTNFCSVKALRCFEVKEGASSRESADPLKTRPSKLLHYES